jgi:hypothetical protein
MQIRENWTYLEGEVADVRQSATRAGFVELDIAVRAARAVEGFANLLGDCVDTTVTVRIRADAERVDELVKGAHVSVRVRRGQSADDVFAHTRSLRIR